MRSMSTTVRLPTLNGLTLKRMVAKLGRQPARLPTLNGLTPKRMVSKLGRHGLARPLLALGAALRETIDPRMLELVTLRVAAARGNRYIWLAHVHFAEQAGLTSTQIARVAFGPRAFCSRDAAVLSCVDHVLAGRPIDEQTRHALGSDDVLAIQIATAFYTAIDSITRGIDPEPGLPPVAGLDTPGDALGSYLATLS